jgi:hypothetical protein
MTGAVLVSGKGGDADASSGVAEHAAAVAALEAEIINAREEALANPMSTSCFVTFTCVQRAWPRLDRRIMIRRTAHGCGIDRRVLVRRGSDGGLVVYVGDGGARRRGMRARLNPKPCSCRRPPMRCFAPA